MPGGGPSIESLSNPERFTRLPADRVAVLLVRVRVEVQLRAVARLLDLQKRGLGIVREGARGGEAQLDGAAAVVVTAQVPLPPPGEVSLSGRGAMKLNSTALRGMPDIVNVPSSANTTRPPPEPFQIPATSCAVSSPDGPV